MGKYYSRIGGNLYIYVTNGDSLIDLKYFPNELNLFTAESAWRIKDKMAIVNDADEANVDKAEIILSLNAYKRWDHSAEILEQYYASDDEEILQEKPVAVAPAPKVEAERPHEMEVIIPEARQPALLRAEEAVTPPVEEVRVAAPEPITGKRVVSIDISDDVIDRIIDRVISRGLVLQYRPTPPTAVPQHPPQYEAVPPGKTPFDELCELLVAIIEREAGGAPRDSIASSLNDLMEATAEYIRSLTPPPKAEKSPTDELMGALTDYLRDRTPRDEEKAPDEEADPLEQLMRLLRREGGRGRHPERAQESARGARDRPSDERLEGRMSEEVSDMYAHIAYKLLRGEASVRNADWLVHIGDHWMELEPVLSLIAEAPHHAMVERAERRPVRSLDASRRSLSETIFDELLYHKSDDDARRREVRELLEAVPLNVIESGLERNYNTLENRMLKAHLQGLISQLEAVEEVCADIERFLNRAVKFSAGSPTAAWAEERTMNRKALAGIDKLKRNIRGYLETAAFLDEVEAGEELPLETEVLRSHPNYSRFYSLKKGYEVNTPPPLHNVRALLPELDRGSPLYERWCWVEIIRSLLRKGFQIDRGSTRFLDGGRGLVGMEDMMVTLSNGESTVRLTTSRSLSGSDRVLDLEVEDSVVGVSKYAFRPMFGVTPSSLESSVRELRRLGVYYNLVVLVHTSDTEPSLSENVYTVSLVPGGSKLGFRGLLGALIS